MVNAGESQFWRPEDRLLLLLLRREVDKEALGQIDQILRDSLDWTYLFDQAREQAVFPLMYQKLLSISPESIPPALRTQLNQEFKNIVRHNLLLTHELIRLLELFGEQEISAIPYKGPIWAAGFYENLASRFFFDLDILVSREDILKAKELLVAQGYRPEHKMNRLQEKWKLLFDCEYQLDHPKTGVHAEIHWRIVPGYIRFNIEMDAVWRRAGTVFLNGREVKTLSEADTLSVLCIHHGAKHLWSDLQSMVDLDRFLSVHDALDWAQLLEQAKKQGIYRILCTGLLLAKGVLNTQLPEALDNAIESDRAVRLFTARISGGLPDKQRQSFPNLKRIVLYFRLRERLVDQLRYLPMLMYDVIRPTEKERSLVTLHGPISFLYVLIRPVRLLLKYAAALLRK